jgi:hypothetical protein
METWSAFSFCGRLESDRPLAGGPPFVSRLEGVSSFRALCERVGLATSSAEKGPLSSVRGIPPLQKAQGWGTRQPVVLHISLLWGRALLRNFLSDIFRHDVALPLVVPDE